MTTRGEPLVIEKITLIGPDTVSIPMNADE